jgi:hypothetical protein
MICIPQREDDVRLRDPWAVPTSITFHAVGVMMRMLTDSRETST